MHDIYFTESPCAAPPVGSFSCDLRQVMVESTAARSPLADHSRTSNILPHGRRHRQPQRFLRAAVQPALPPAAIPPAHGSEKHHEAAQPHYSIARDLFLTAASSGSPFLWHRLSSA
ncbi:unnamed protein product [Victoria cruziana]